MKPIHINDKEPNIGQRCNVYDPVLMMWIYAFYRYDESVKKRRFEEWQDGRCHVIYDCYWIPEPETPIRFIRR